MKIDRQFIFTIVIGIMMITWAMSLALNYNIKTVPAGMQIESVYDRALTGPEKVSILKSGRVLIEFLHNGDFDSLNREAEYENFVARFRDLVVLEAVEVSQENSTLNQMIVPSGDIIPLKNVSESELIDVFCDNSLVQPKECLLRSM